MPERTEKYYKGLEIRKQALGEAGEVRRRLFEAFDPDLMHYQMEFIFGDVMARPNIDPKTREMITLAIAIAGGVEREVRSHTRGFLNHGGTKEELVDLILQCAVYAGFPRAVAATYGVIEVFEERGLFQRPKESETVLEG